jgi:hypothetical protein
VRRKQISSVESFLADLALVRPERYLTDYILTSSGCVFSRGFSGD